MLDFISTGASPAQESELAATDTTAQRLESAGASDGSDLPTRGRAGARAHLYIGVPIGVVLLAFVWMVTCGTWEITVPESFGQFFDVQAESLLAGRWDVAPRGIAIEAFIHNGKFYGYFGFVPALARIALNAVAPSLWGCWSRISMTLGCCVSLIYAYLLLLETRRAVGLGPALKSAARWVYAGFLITAGLGSTLIFLASRAYIYHEAIIWGGALALGCYCHMMRYVRRPTTANLLITAGLCFGSFFSRASVGSGAVVAMLLLTVGLFAAWLLEHQPGKPRWWKAPLRFVKRLARAPVAPKGHVLAAGATVLAVVGVYIAVNQAKFGTWFDGMPFRYYNQVVFEPTQQRMQRTHGQAVSWANFRTDVNAYFSTRNIRFTRAFPFVANTPDAYFYPESRYATVEPYSSLSASMPALSLLALVGLLCALGPKRRPVSAKVREGGLSSAVKTQTPAPSPPSSTSGGERCVMIGAIAGAVPVLLSAGISERYLHDFYPLLIVGGALGMNWALALRPAPLRRGLLVGLAGLALFSVWTNVAFALVYQRTIVWGVPLEKQIEFLQWQDQVAGWIKASPRPG
jgi:hypothetical protein